MDAHGGAFAGGGLVVPVCLWQKSAPTHRICVVSSLGDGRLVVTGSFDGPLCIWEHDLGAEHLEPKYLLLAHESAVSCVAGATANFDDGRFVSASRDGKTCLWDGVDGRCIDSTVTSYVHSRIVPHDIVGGRLVCIGNYSEIVVLDADDLQIAFTLCSRVEPDWFSAFLLLKPIPSGSRHDIVIGISQAGIVKIWSLTGTSLQNVGSTIYEDESKQIQCGADVMSLSSNVENPRMMLVVAKRRWQVFDASDFAELLMAVSPARQTLLDGCFFRIDKVAVFCSDGVVYLYQLPRSQLKGKAVNNLFGPSPKNLAGASEPFCYSILRYNQKCARPPCYCYFDLRNAANGDRNVSVFRGDLEGRLCHWRIPDVADRSIASFKQETFESYPECNPDVSNSFQHAWSTLANPPKGILGHLEDDEHRITASHYVSSQGRLVLGRSDGSVMLLYAPHALAKQLLSLPKEQLNSPDWPAMRIIEAAHDGPVSVLLYPHEQHSRYDVHLLITGGEDFCVNLWDLYSCTKIYKFCVQAGPILQFLIPPENCNVCSVVKSHLQARVLQSVCSVAADHSVAVLGLKEHKCVLLASRHIFPVRQVKWRPFDDFLVVHTEDNAVYVWQMETANLDRIVTGVTAEEVLEACDEQCAVGRTAGEDPTANTAVQMFRAIRHRNVAAMKRIAGQQLEIGAGVESECSSRGSHVASESLIMRPIRCHKSDAEAHVALFRVDSLILDLMDEERTARDSSSACGAAASASASPTLGSSCSLPKFIENYYAESLQPVWVNFALFGQLCSRGGSGAGGLLSRVRGKAESILSSPSLPSQQPKGTVGVGERPRRAVVETSLAFDVAQTLLSLLHGWSLDVDLDHVCSRKLALLKPRFPLCFGLVSRQGYLSLLLPTYLERWQVAGRTSPSEETTAAQKFCGSLHWQISSTLTSHHLLSLVALANTLMSMQGASFSAGHVSKRLILKRLSAAKAGQQTLSAEVQSTLQTLLTEQSQIQQGWSLLAALHCVLLPELVDKSVYKPPRIELLARRWQDRCLKVREAAQALLVRELNRRGADGRKSLVDQWAHSLPTLLPPAISILGNRMFAHHLQSPAQPNPNEAEIGSTAVAGAGLQQLRRNQATAVVLLAVVGAEFGQEIDASISSSSPPLASPAHPAGFTQADYSLARATGQSLLELLLQPPTALLPLHSPLRSAAASLIGRGFIVWQPYLDISKVLTTLLELCADRDKTAAATAETSEEWGWLSAEVDSRRTAKQALAHIAAARPPAFITALSKEVARYNSQVQHQAVQHSLVSTLFKSRQEILAIIEMLAEKHYNDVADLMIAVGEILVHCLDTSLLKHRSLADIFPPITKFYMVAYCPNTRRMAFGGKNGSVAIHELRLGKTQMIQAHSGAVTACAFSEDEKHLATYSADEGKVNFWQASQSFLGMGQSQIKNVKQVNAPQSFPVQSPGGGSAVFRARLVWISQKALTLMLPNGKEYRFAV